MEMDFLKELSAFGNIGLGLLIFCVWYYERRDREKDTDRVAEYMGKILCVVESQKKMYEDNVALVRHNSDQVKFTQEYLLQFIQKITELGSAVQNNQFCPLMRSGDIKKTP